MAAQEQDEVGVGDISALEDEECEQEVEVGDNSALEDEECEISPPETDDSNATGCEKSSTLNKPEENQSKKPCNIVGEHPRATIMVAGRARNGKSTALNNIFGLNLTAKASSKSVTQVVSVSEVTKKIPKPKPQQKQQLGGREMADEEVTLRVIDTPGLGAVDIKKETILKDMKSITEGEDYTLMYCFSVSPNTNITETDKIILENLQQSLGKEVWSKCVLLFTFSDYACEEFEDSQEEYVEYIKSHATEFQTLLRSVTRNDSIAIKTIFDYKSPEELEKDEKPSEIIAIPVNKKPKKSKDILPGILRERQDWTDIVFVELMKKTDKNFRTPFVLYKYPSIYECVAVGASIGSFAGPAGMAVGALGGLTVGGVLAVVKWIKQ